MTQLNHPILEKSFAIIDAEVGEHHLSSQEYAIARRVIHTTADFDYLNLLQFSSNAIASGINALRQRTPIITDVTMIKQGIITLVSKTFQNPIIAAVEQASIADSGKTRTETGLLRTYSQYPQGVYLIGNAPTALLALCDQVAESPIKPALIIGATVGFVSVVESKQALAALDVPQIRVQGRKGGSPVAAAILNALLVLAWDHDQSSR
ncbi:cobalt-precorrin-8X methylmutase [Gloeothece verrucosa]|uniref:Precorrin-8X methylmutase CbiC/CobH n=1 Tax=Gloeothece verrucosa (strain PCC 7822) TaxID=497965 RepID=E0UK09_GLOV7|nr:cobalt-precorrin-8X methylmutase [Gloeothece verrucosa]ADN14645.1 Precorrin-8X methylmutase CbiC/CobH [Gloeothece verrucosa PCC 7822]